ncbi:MULTISPECIES: hypothetical protein [unclassified Streptomyces]|uniref:hypothetical protein n=1 Tax=unclassified Streptomyces TaxID=2593676 RepID=UPI0033F4CA2A
MPLVVKIALIVIGVALLALALIGSGISRRLMTIPKMHRAPRIALAILGVLLLAGGMWGLSTTESKKAPSVADVKEHIPSSVKADLNCTEAAESPKGAAEVDCSTQNSTPEYVYYILFSNVDDMQVHWNKTTAPGDLSGNQCQTMDDYKKGSHQTYYTNDQSVIIGDYACYTSGDSIVAVYTDRRYNVIVSASITDPKNFPEFIKWVNDTSQPVGDEGATPATPSQTAAAGR